MIDRGLLGQLLGDNPEIATEEAPLHGIRTSPEEYPADSYAADSYAAMSAG